MIQPILRILLIIIQIIIINKMNAQDGSVSNDNSFDTTIIINFDWNKENQKRQESKMSYASANICSRWIKFSDSEFLRLKKYDNKRMAITLNHRVHEGLKSMKARGVNTYGMQGTSENISCDFIIKIIPIDEATPQTNFPLQK